MEPYLIIICVVCVAAIVAGVTIVMNKKKKDTIPATEHQSALREIY